MKNNKGFTLIELLVVVLIIGILAAIALPQYFKAVEKSRIAEANTVIGAINHAEQIFSMAAETPTTFSTIYPTLDVDKPLNCAWESGTNPSKLICPYFTYVLSGASGGASATSARVVAYRNAVDKQASAQASLASEGTRGYAIALRFVDGARCYKETSANTTVAPGLGLPACANVSPAITVS